MTRDNYLLNALWRKIFKAPWVLGLLLIFAWGIPRFILVLNANETGNYQLVSVIFISMWIAPWIFLSKSGRKKAGIRKPAKFSWLFYGFLTGVLASTLMFLIASLAYGDTINNWFVYISNSYGNLPQELTSSDRLIYFLIYAITSMIFSPIGEEFFYRGIVHECFATKVSDRMASYIDSLAFSLTHLAHFGLVFVFGEWQFLFIPALLWVTLLFFVCLMFSYVKIKSSSVFGAVFTHTGFNLAMIYFIFYHIL